VRVSTGALAACRDNSAKVAVDETKELKICIDAQWII
jgi:hypothetical protein